MTLIIPMMAIKIFSVTSIIGTLLADRLQPCFWSNALIFHQSISMSTQSQQSLIIFIISVILLLLLFSTFIITIIYKYKKKQLAHQEHIESIKVSHENTLLQSQVEIQEQTFEHIAREIHDNIGQKLTLAKLYLNTTIANNAILSEQKVQDLLVIVSEAITDLSDLSRSMGTNNILENGLVKAIENEIHKLTMSGKYRVNFSISGNELFLDTQKELILFRIVQEAMNNIIKHSGASNMTINVSYKDDHLCLAISDDGAGFQQHKQPTGNGLVNIHKRTKMLKGSCNISSSPAGTTLTVNIPVL